MTDDELLKVSEQVLQDAITEAEFTRAPKDLEYVKIVAQKVEGLRAKITGRKEVELETVGMRDGRIYVQWKMDLPGLFREAKP